MSEQPVLRELVTSAGENYWQEWYCEVPPELSAFTVLDEDWAREAGGPVRRIWRITYGPPAR
jgi:hypothetical protein